MKRTKILTVLLSATLVFSQQAVWADEITVIDDTLSYSEESEEVRQVLQSQAEHIEELEEGIDYVERQAFFIAENEEEAAKVAGEYGGELESYDEGIAVLSFEKSVDEVIKEAANDSSEASTVIYPDYLMELEDYEDSSADPGRKNQWFHDQINNETAWEFGYTGKGVRVGVLDTGIDSDHEDLVDNIYEAVPYESGDDFEDENGHGSHVAGIIAETCGNGIGGCGVARDAKIYSVKVGTSSTITISNMLKGLHKAVDAGCKVINISLACASAPDEATITAMQEAVDYAYEKGVTVVAAAGNYSSDKYYYPAALDHVISVAAVTKEGQLASYSNYGDWIDIAAPGSSIYATYSGGGYKYQSGTSMSAPVAAGALAIIYSSDEKLLNGCDSDTSDRVKEILLSASDGKTYQFSGMSFGGGCIDFNVLFSDDAADDEEENNKEEEAPSETPDYPEESDPSSESEESEDESDKNTEDKTSEDKTTEDKTTESENKAENDNSDSSKEEVSDNKSESPEKKTDDKETEKTDDSIGDTDETKNEKENKQPDEEGTADSRKASDSLTDDTAVGNGAGETEKESDNSTSSNVIRSTVEIGNGSSATYYSSLTYTGKKLTASDIDMTINHNGEKISVTKFKLRNCKHNGIATVTIKKLATSDKNILNEYKGRSFEVKILPKKLEASDVMLVFSANGGLKNVYTFVNGKKHKINKKMYTYDGNVGKLTFSGDYVGSISV